jgi:hypothetical protein
MEGTLRSLREMVDKTMAELLWSPAEQAASGRHF